MTSESQDSPGKPSHKTSLNSIMLSWPEASDFDENFDEFSARVKNYDSPATAEEKIGPLLTGTHKQLLELYSDCKNLESPEQSLLLNKLEYDLIDDSPCDSSLGGNFQQDRRPGSLSENFKSLYLVESINNLNKNKNYFELYKMLLYHYKISQKDSFIFTEIYAKILFVDSNSDLLEGSLNFGNMDRLYQRKFSEKIKENLAIETFRCRVNYYLDRNVGFEKMDGVPIVVYLFGVGLSIDDVAYEKIFLKEARTKVNYGILVFPLGGGQGSLDEEGGDREELVQIR